MKSGESFEKIDNFFYKKFLEIKKQAPNMTLEQMAEGLSIALKHLGQDSDYEKILSIFERFNSRYKSLN